MALVVEDGTGKTDAESYASVADIDAILAAIYRTVPTEWSGLSSGDKEITARDGTRYLDATYSQRWEGVRTNDTQALAFPRDGITDRDGYALDNATIPSELEEALAEACIRSAQQGTTKLIPDHASPGSIKRKAVSVGPLSQDITYVGGSGQAKTFPEITKLLRRRSLIHSNSMVRG